MKHLSKSLLGFLFVSGLQFASSGCVSDGYASGTVYYGPRRDPWFHDDRWMDGNRGYRDAPRGGRADIYISPPRIPRPPSVRVRLP